MNVHVSSGYRDWGLYWYCNAAIDTDRNNGFKVEEVTNEDGDQ